MSQKIILLLVCVPCYIKAVKTWYGILILAIKEWKIAAFNATIKVIVG